MQLLHFVPALRSAQAIKQSSDISSSRAELGSRTSSRAKSTSYESLPNIETSLFKREINGFRFSLSPIRMLFLILLLFSALSNSVAYAQDPGCRTCQLPNICPAGTTFSCSDSSVPCNCPQNCFSPTDCPAPSPCTGAAYFCTSAQTYCLCPPSCPASPPPPAPAPCQTCNAEAILFEAMGLKK